MPPRRFPREEEATLVEHLEELRGRIMVSLAAVAVATAVAFVFHNRILEWLARPLPPDHRHLAAFGVTEPFSVSIAVSLYAGLLFALPRFRTFESTRVPSSRTAAAVSSHELSMARIRILFPL